MGRRSLTLGELEACPGALLAVLLALLAAWVTREITRTLEREAMGTVEFLDRTRNPMTKGPGLTGHPTAVNRGVHVVALQAARRIHRPPDHDLQGISWEIGFHRSAVDRNRAVSQ